jgi:nitrate/nitrite-specific signal transduction histidine kinase
MRTNFPLTSLARTALGTLLMGTLFLSAEPAAEAPKPNATELAAPTNTLAELINIAGKQRMLSQRIAKDYLYIGKKIAVDKATRQLKQSLEEFAKSQTYLAQTIDDAEITNLIAFVNMSLKELKATAKKPFNLDNAQLVLDLSESMLEGSQYIVDSLKAKSKAAKQDSTIVAISGKQRMLAQRIAKYYIAYQSGIKDKNTVDQMKETVRQFDENNKRLINNPNNSVDTSAHLKKIDMLWKIVYKFYLNIEKGGLPFIVFTSTDDITHRMDLVTELYAKEKH